ncbi:MAG: DUF444 family protein [Candidatus Obscuribacter sp.]|nr:DUF444 family protein [Candidatus Obscuribacter sp.]
MSWKCRSTRTTCASTASKKRDDPDSKAWVALVLDRSGSMSGDPIIIAKAYFFICVLFLKTKYKEVAISMISHDAQEYLWKTEEEFFKIGAGGGTVAVPAWELVFNIAEYGARSKTTNVSAGPYPAAAWNRYMFHATDGDLFDGEEAIRDWFTKIIRAPFNYVGYLEVGTSWSGRSGYSLGGQALKGLPNDVKAHLGMAKASQLADVPEVSSRSWIRIGSKEYNYERKSRKPALHLSARHGAADDVG